MHRCLRVKMVAEVLAVAGVNTKAAAKVARAAEAAQEIAADTQVHQAARAVLQTARAALNANIHPVIYESRITNEK